VGLGYLAVIPVSVLLVELANRTGPGAAENPILLGLGDAVLVASWFAGAVQACRNRDRRAGTEVSTHPRGAETERPNQELPSTAASVSAPGAQSSSVSAEVSANEGRIRRSWRLTAMAWGLMLENRTMWILAFLGVGFAALGGALILYLGGYFAQPSQSRAHVAVVGLIALYPSTLISVFFNVALASAASAALGGRRIGLKQALFRSSGRLKQIAVWSLLAAGVGFLLHEIAGRLPGGGKLATWLAGAAWSLATMFVVPILALEDTRAIPAVRNSAALIRQRWGEGVAGNLTIGAWLAIALFPLCMAVGVGASLAESSPTVATVLVSGGVIAMIVISVLAVALRQVFAVALYHYATGGPVEGFTLSDLEQPFSGGRARRPPWIRWAIYSLMAVVVLVFLLGPLRRESGSYSWRDGYYRASFPAAASDEIRDGMAVRYRGREIGTVVDHWEEGYVVFVVYRVELSLRRVANHADLTLYGPPGETFLQMRRARAVDR
jgi:hypothetical protein